MDKTQGKRRPVDTTRHHRENGWDYRGRAIYHFTLPVEERYPLFGILTGENAEKAFIKLNPFGLQVCKMLGGLAQFYERKGYALKVLTQMVMPDHVHLVIQVLEPLPQSIGAVVRGFKSACTKVYKEEYFCSGENAAKVHGEGTLPEGENAAKVHGEGTLPEGKNAAGVHGEGEKALVHFARIFAGRGSIWQQDPAHYHERILHAPAAFGSRRGTLTSSVCTDARRSPACRLPRWATISSSTGLTDRRWKCRAALLTTR